MSLPESNTHSFIVKLWSEETDEQGGRVSWRGHITHVPSGARRYLQHLDDIQAFIVPYLEAIGVRFNLFWRIKRRLKKWKL